MTPLLYSKIIMFMYAFFILTDTITLAFATWKDKQALATFLNLLLFKVVLMLFGVYAVYFSS